MTQEAAAPALREALEKINEWVCYASEEDVNAKPMAMQQIGVIARAALAARPAEFDDDATPAEPSVRPDILERLTYHARERNDLSLDDCLNYLARGWYEVPGRTEREMVLQILSLLAGEQDVHAE